MKPDSGGYYYFALSTLQCTKKHDNLYSTQTIKVYLQTRIFQL